MANELDQLIEQKSKDIGVKVAALDEQLSQINDLAAKGRQEKEKLVLAWKKRRDELTVKRKALLEERKKASRALGSLNIIKEV